MSQDTTDSTGATGAAYKQIEISLRGKIRAGHWPIGAMLPSRRELAREYGVSPITIERAINPLISEGLLRADDRRGTFVADAAVVSVAAASTWPAHPEVAHGATDAGFPAVAASPATATIGIVASLYAHNHDHLALNDFWVRLIVQSLEQTLSDNGHRTLFFNRVQTSDGPARPLRAAIEAALAQGVDALAIVSFGLAPQEVDASLAALDGRDVPVVCITSGPLRRPVPHVFFDSRSAGYEAARRILHTGCRDLLFFSPFTTTWVEDRIEGIQAAVEHAGLPADVLRIAPEPRKPWVQEEDPEPLGYDAARAYLAQGARPRGVITANDGIAFGFVRAAAEQGMTPGIDFTLVSFDDHPNARSHQLTTLRPPMEEMGREASRLLLRALGGAQADLQVRLRWHLIPRASCSAASFLPASTERGNL